MDFIVFFILGLMVSVPMAIGISHNNKEEN